MSQSPLFDAHRYEPVTFTVRLVNVGQRQQLETAVSLTSTNILGDVLLSRTVKWVGEEHDQLPEGVMAAVAAHLWGPDVKAPLRGLLTERDSVQHLIKRRARLFDV